MRRQSLYEIGAFFIFHRESANGGVGTKAIANLKLRPDEIPNKTNPFL
jgi:hypothetical protein